MVSVTDKLSEANAALQKDDCKINEIGKLLAEAGKIHKEIDTEVIEMIEVTEEYEVLDSTLTEFIELEEAGKLETEELAAASITAQEESLLKMTEKYKSSIEIDVSAMETVTV